VARIATAPGLGRVAEPDYLPSVTHTVLAPWDGLEASQRRQWRARRGRLAVDEDAGGFGVWRGVSASAQRTGHRERAGLILQSGIEELDQEILVGQTRDPRSRGGALCLFARMRILLRAAAVHRVVR